MIFRRCASPLLCKWRQDHVKRARGHLLQRLAVTPVDRVFKYGFSDPPGGVCSSERAPSLTGDAAHRGGDSQDLPPACRLQEGGDGARVPRFRTSGRAHPERSRDLSLFPRRESSALRLAVSSQGKSRAVAARGSPPAAPTRASTSPGRVAHLAPAHRPENPPFKLPPPRAPLSPHPAPPPTPPLPPPPLRPPPIPTPKNRSPTSRWTAHRSSGTSSTSSGTRRSSRRAARSARRWTRSPRPPPASRTSSRRVIFISLIHVHDIRTSLSCSSRTTGRSPASRFTLLSGQQPQSELGCGKSSPRTAPASPPGHR